MLATQPLAQVFSRDSTSPSALVSFGLPESSQPVHLQSGRHGEVGVIVAVPSEADVAVARVAVVSRVGVAVILGVVTVDGNVVGVPGKMVVVVVGVDGGLGVTVVVGAGVGVCGVLCVGVGVSAVVVVDGGPGVTVVVGVVVVVSPEVVLEDGIRVPVEVM